MTRKLIPQQRNANKHTLHGLRLLEKSIQSDGFIDAQTAAADGEIISGSARLELSAEKFADVEPIIVESDGSRPVVVVRTDIPTANDPRAKRLSVAANQIAKTDFNPDGELLAEWGGEDEAIRAMFADSEWEEITGEKKPTKDAEPQTDRAAELLEKWGVQPGDLWQIGEHRLICGDCTDAATVARVMGGEKASLYFSDPPYNIGFSAQRNKETYKDTSDELTDDGYLSLLRGAFDNAMNHTDRAIITCGKQNLKLWMRHFEIDEIAVWIAKNKMSGGKVSHLSLWEPVLFFGKFERSARSNDLLEYNTKFQPEADDHPCPKIIDLWEEIIKCYSAGVVYDSFCGSGTTLAACENLGQKARCAEISPAYVAVALERMATAFPALEIKRLE
jgi:DNA modification methylase